MEELYEGDLIEIIKIETYWNVNTGKSLIYYVHAIIKIETYWNVN